MIVNKETEDVDRTYGTFAEDKKQTGDAFPPLRVSYDDVLEEIGEFGRWQQWQSFVYSVPPFMSGALFMLGTFTSRRVVPQIDPSVPHPVVQSRRRPLLGPSPG